MNRALFSLVVFLGLFFVVPQNLYAQTVAKVVGLQNAATLQRGLKRSALVRNFDLMSGDRIRTDETGQVQVVFVDRTRVVIGPNSDFHVKDVKISTGKKASKFVVRALRGSFRFLSGDSAKETYEIKTPSVTMGIRGTDFDFVVASRRQTRVVAFDGEVQVCNRRNRCARLVGGCALVSVQQRQFDLPETAEDRVGILARNFPFVVNQGRFPGNFQVETGACGDVETAVRALRVQQATPAQPAGTLIFERRENTSPSLSNDAPAPAAPAPAPAAPPQAEPQEYNEAADEA